VSAPDAVSPFARDPDALRALLASVVESSDDAIVTKTLTGVITSWNAAAERLLGYPHTEAVGSPITMIIPADRLDEERTIIAKLRAGERIEHYETQRVRKDGRVIEVELTISPLRDGTGTIVGASKILRDVTERKRVDRELQRLLAEHNEILERERGARAQAEKVSASKDQFLAMLSHELRTPLNAILGWTQVLRSGRGEPADYAKGLEVIERNVRLQSQLVEDLLDMSRIVAGQMRLDVQALMPFGLVQAAVESLRPVAAKKSLRIETTLDPSAGPISGDGGRLQQVVWNLVSNAIKFTPDGGRVQVVLARVNSHIEISVADTGIGIEAELLPHVFERFRQGDTSITRHYGGLGLGLSIVKHIVDLHGGNVQVASGGKGQGATFRVQLPLAVVQRERDAQRLHPRAALTPPPMAYADLRGLDVLVVDDEQDSRELVRRVLEDAGAKVRTAANAVEALGVARDRAADVLVTDIGMPDTDGYELLRQLRCLGDDTVRRMPAIALTAFARSEDRTRALLAGFLAHVAKPVEAPELVATVAAVAQRSR
jgi:PAS domain S-box-containing protein